MEQEAMTLLVCPRCQRANPGEARFCHFDGWELRIVNGIAMRGGELGREFVFPSGVRCKTYDDLARGCMQDWNVARNLLKQGGLRQFMAGIGRMDLAVAAEKAAALSDLDLGLDQFIAQLPTRDALGPRLDLNPRRLNLGRLRVGETRQIPLVVLNQGARLLSGTMEIDAEDWLGLGDGAKTFNFKTGKQQQIDLQLDTAGLIAGQKYAGKLTFITNGGVAEVPIQFEIGTVPFATAPLQGAASPRDLAMRMRDKEAARLAGPLLESGEVERWFRANGWRYPVQGPPAKGVAAVQQFFEALGLSRPPPLFLSPSAVDATVMEGEKAHQEAVLSTNARKWVYAQVESDVPWLAPEQPDVGGAQRATVKFALLGKHLIRGQKAEGKLLLRANGGQRLELPVRVAVRPAPRRAARGLVTSFAKGALVAALARLLGCLPDVLGRDWRSMGAWLTSSDFVGHYVGYFVLATFWLGIPLGAWLAWRRGKIWDVPAGALVGGVTGLIVSATLASLYPVVDQTLYRLLPFTFPMIAVLVWALAGGVIGTGLWLVRSLIGPRRAPLEAVRG
jgi:hypothetical protein